MLNITSDERRTLRARAHSLHPVVSISQNGLSESVVKEINASLASHELIKVRVYNDDRASARETSSSRFASNCRRASAAYRQAAGDLASAPGSAERGEQQTPRRSEPRRSKRSFQGSSGN
jgi:RNA-binding protein